jgi:hypothetical protein
MHVHIQAVTVLLHAQAAEVLPAVVTQQRQAAVKVQHGGVLAARGN